MTALTSQFIAQIQRTPFTLVVDGRTVVVRASRARFGLVSAEAEVMEGDVRIGYLTAYSETERGAVPASQVGLGAPRLFRELEPAVRLILRKSPAPNVD
ncbi:hypothetical protein [Gryllotalpicola koreensis]|uniref:Uncharacterized protein n=1 Tax=Gryllotalpicola koreensis TaxID=993086 RepID=A0ABP8A2R0_9MICO